MNNTAAASSRPNIRESSTRALHCATTAESDGGLNRYNRQPHSRRPSYIEGKELTYFLYHP